MAIENGFQDRQAIELLQAIHRELGTPEAGSALRHGSSMTQLATRIASQRPARSRFWAWPRILGAAFQYWFTGRNAQAYHLSQSRNYEQARDYMRAAHHARQFLDLAEHAETRARLAYAYSMLRRDADAVREYRRAAAAWDHPAILLGLAQAEFRTGNVATAHELLEDVQKSYLGHYLRHAIAELKAQMG